MNNKIIMPVAAVGLLISVLLGWLLIPVSAGVTLYMYQDKPTVAEEAAKGFINTEITKYVHESTKYVYTYPETEPWKEYVYVIRGKASRLELHRIDSEYRKYCYNLAVKVNPQFSLQEQALLWSAIS